MLKISPARYVKGYLDPLQGRPTRNPNTANFQLITNPQILIQILSSLPTRQILPLARISHRFHDITLRIVHTRLTDTAWLPDHELILECYHPSAKLTTPYLHCDYLGTDGLASYRDEVESTATNAQPDFPQLRNLYSRFRPVVQEENRRGRARYPMAASGGSSNQVVEGDDDDDRTATLTVDLEEGEMFSQLCAVTNMVKVGPRRGLFLSHVNVCDGVVRVFRRWLAAQASGSGDEDPVLWTDWHQTVGLKFRVQQNTADARRQQQQRPALWSAAEEEDLPVSYTLVYDELLVRTSTLLLEVEKSEDQEVTSTGKAIVIASL